MVGKKGFLRTMEAVVAILLVLGFLLYILPRRPVYAESTMPEGIESSRDFILTEIMNNKEIRECVGSAVIASGMSKDNSCSSTYNDCSASLIPVLDRHLLPGFEYACEICTTVAPCYPLPTKTIDRTIYPGAVFMYFGGSNVRYVRIYFWRE